jgi:uncharacterized protein (TIRG00374 family)
MIRDNATAKMLSKKLIGPLIGIAFLILAFRTFRYGEFVDAVRDFNFYYLPPVLTIFFVSYLIRGIRWRIILNSVKRISFYNSFSAILIGQMGNNLLPARLGEIIRAYVIGNRENISKSSSLASIILERTFDGVTLIILLAVLVSFLHFPLWVEKMVLLSTIIFGSVFFFLTVCVYKTEEIMKFLKRRLPLLDWKNPEKVSSVLMKFISGLGLLKDKKKVIIVFIFSIMVWICEAIVYYALFKALGIVVPFYASIFVLAVINFGIMIPSLPAGIGTFHYACIIALTVFNVNKNVGLVYSVILHGIMYFSLVSSGLFFMSKFGFRIGELQRLSETNVRSHQD